jgi:hypothetical protein
LAPLEAVHPIWFGDEARIGQNNKIARRWARRGTRPAAPANQRTGSMYIFGAICPARGAGAGLVLPVCNSATMSMQLAELSQAVSAGAQAVVLLDQAGWHTSDKLRVPANISLLPLPPKSPELVWGLPCQASQWQLSPQSGPATRSSAVIDVLQSEGSSPL